MDYANKTFSNEWNLSGDAMPWETANELGGENGLVNVEEVPTPVLGLSVNVLLGDVDPSYYSIYKSYSAVYNVTNSGKDDLTDVVLTYTIGSETLTYTFASIKAGESATFTAATVSATPASVAVSGSVTDPATSGIITASDPVTFVDPNVVTNNSDKADMVGSFRWVLANAEPGHDIVFSSKYAIAVTNGVLAVSNYTIDGAQSTLTGGAGSQNLTISGTTTIKNLNVTNRFIGNAALVESGSTVILENFSYTSSQGEINFNGTKLNLNNTSIVGNKDIGCTISSNTNLTINGVGSSFTGNYSLAGGSLGFVTSEAAETTAMLAVSGAVTVAGSLWATLTDQSAVASYILVSGSGVSSFDGKTFTVNGQTAVVNGDVAEVGDIKFSLTTDANKLYLSIVDVRPQGTVWIKDWPAAWSTAPSYAYVVTDSTGNFYSGDNASTFTTVQVNGSGLGTIFGGTTTAIEVPAYIQITGKVGTVFGGGSEASAADTFIQLKDTARVYNLYGGGKSGNVSTVNMAMEGGSVNYLFGGGYNASTGAVNITMDGGSVWKFFGGAANGSVTGNILINVNGGAITNSFFGAGIGNVDGNVTVNFGSGVNLSTKPILYGGAMAGVTGAISSGTAEMEKIYSDGTQNVTIAGAVALNFNSTTLSGMVIGGNFNNAAALVGGIPLTSAIAGGVTLNFNGANSSSWIFGGSYVASEFGSDTISNGVTLNFTGVGSYKQVFGGSRAEKGGTATVSNVDINISGGTFNDFVVAGGYASGTSKSTVTGDITFNVNTADSVVTFGKSIYLGGYAHSAGSEAMVQGNATITFTGLGSNLNFTGSVNGSGFGAGNTMLGGFNTIEFDNYTGDFNGVIRAFSDISFKGNTSVNFTTELTPELFDSWEFNLAGRTSAAAMVTIKNSAEISLTADATERAIAISVSDLTTDSGSYLLVDAVDDLLADLSGLSFDFGIKTSEGVLVNTLVTNAKDWLSAAGFNWKLECDGNQLVLAWEKITEPAAAAAFDLLSASDMVTDLCADMATVTLDETIDWRKSEHGLLA